MLFANSTHSGQSSCQLVSRRKMQPATIEDNVLVKPDLVIPAPDNVTPSLSDEGTCETNLQSHCVFVTLTVMLV